MPRYIDADALYEQTAEWEASALAYIAELNRTPLEEMDEDEKAEWRRWTAILGERSAFKHDVADAPTIDAVQVVRCKDCKFYDFWESVGTHICACSSGDPYEAAQIGEDDFCSFAERRDDGDGTEAG